MRHPKKRYYSYEQFEKDLKIIVKKLNGNYKDFKDIYPVPRGGLLLGLRLSHILNLPLIFDKKKITLNTMIVDEVVDSGKTLQTYKNYFIITLHYKPKTASFKPKIYVHETSEWIVYFWEKVSL